MLDIIAYSLGVSGTVDLKSDIISNIKEFELYHSVGYYGDQLRIWFKKPIIWRGNEQEFALVRYKDNKTSFVSKLKKYIYENGRVEKGMNYNRIFLKPEKLGGDNS